MKRVRDIAGIVHFCGKDACIALCGSVQSADLLGRIEPMSETSEPVTCHMCAELYCRIKNAPWNEVGGAALDYAICEAVKEECNAGTPLQ